MMLVLRWRLLFRRALCAFLGRAPIFTVREHRLFFLIRFPCLLIAVLLIFHVEDRLLELGQRLLLRVVHGETLPRVRAIVGSVAGLALRLFKCLLSLGREVTLLFTFIFHIKLY